MTTRRAALAGLAGLVMALAVGPGRTEAAAIDPQAARAFIQELSEDAVRSLTDGAVPKAQRIRRFRRMFTDHFAVKAMGKWILGRHWRKATESQRTEYLRLFEDLMVVSYVDRFAEYAGESLKTVRAVQHGETIAIVFSEIVQPGSSKPIRVDWRVGRASDALKILDVVVEGTSMSQTLRSDFGSTIRRRGGTVEGLLEALREKTAELKKEDGG